MRRPTMTRLMAPPPLWGVLTTHEPALLGLEREVMALAAATRCRPVRKSAWNGTGSGKPHSFGPRLVRLLGKDRAGAVGDAMLWAEGSLIVARAYLRSGLLDLY